MLCFTALFIKHSHILKHTKRSDKYKVIQNDTIGEEGSSNNTVEPLEPKLLSINSYTCVTVGNILRFRLTPWTPGIVASR